jgi:hypothetical protein
MKKATTTHHAAPEWPAVDSSFILHPSSFPEEEARHAV